MDTREIAVEVVKRVKETDSTLSAILYLTRVSAVKKLLQEMVGKEATVIFHDGKLVTGALTHPHAFYCGEVLLRINTIMDVDPQTSFIYVGEN